MGFTCAILLKHIEARYEWGRIGCLVRGILSLDSVQIMEALIH